MKIKEVIVVEGRHDTSVLQQYFDCDTIETNGLSLSEETLRLIEEARDRCGVIIFTDPDHPGETIRRRINEAVKGCKNAYIAKNKAKTPRKVGVEHARRKDLEEALQTQPLTKELLYEVESRGFTDSEILRLSGVSREVLQDIRIYNDIFPVYKMVDTCGGEFDAATPYYYSCYDEEDEVEVSPEEKILVVGSGPIRIGQGIEFDYCCVQGVWAIKDLGYEAIIMNNNPETVSTDFDTSD